MTNPPQERQRDPETVEDLAPREDESAELKGGGTPDPTPPPRRGRDA